MIDSYSGSNSNGMWVRFGDGTQICSIQALRVEFETVARLMGEWTFPMEFVNGTVAVVATRRATHGGSFEVGSIFGASTGNRSNATVRGYLAQGTGSYSSGNASLVGCFAMGRWK